MNKDTPSFDYKTFQASERVVEINSLLNGIEGDTLKCFGYHLQNIRKKVFEDLKNDSDEDLLMKELEGYVDNYYMNTKQHDFKARLGGNTAFTPQFTQHDLKNMKGKNMMIQQLYHGHAAENLETTESRNDFHNLKKLLGISGTIHH